MTATGTNVNATAGAGRARARLLQGRRSVWYRWTAPRTGSVTFDTAGSAYDIRASVYTGYALGS